MLMDNYAPLNEFFVRGQQAFLYDSEDRSYLDALAGIAVCGLGHGHPAVTEALCKQATKLLHTSNLYRIPLQEKLAAVLNERAVMEKAFFANSGAEANEAAIKLARLYGHQHGYKMPVIIVMEGGFHGRTMATLAATGNSKVKKGFGPLLPGFVHIPFNCINALEEAIVRYSEVVAVMLEPIQGEAGVIVPACGYLKAVRRICDDNGLLMILDEVQTGMCRTGKWFAYQHEASLLPDIVTLAKALGNGVPIGACLARGISADLFYPGSHGSTFGGNPLAAAASLAVMQTLAKDELAERAASLGARMLQVFSTRLAQHPNVREIRGCGLMIGIELDRECRALVSQALEQRLLINVTAANVIRLLPPLIITDDQADQIVARVCQLIIDFFNN